MNRTKKLFLDREIPSSLHETILSFFTHLIVLSIILGFAIYLNYSHSWLHILFYPITGLVTYVLFALMLNVKRFDKEILLFAFAWPFFGVFVIGFIVTMNFFRILGFIINK